MIDGLSKRGLLLLKFAKVSSCTFMIDIASGRVSIEFPVARTLGLWLYLSILRHEDYLFHAMMSFLGFKTLFITRLLQSNKTRNIKYNSTMYMSVTTKSPLR